MNTPICDFVKNYSNSDILRLHMPGHKGTAQKDFEPCAKFDITEINGADDLYHSCGIIRKSEENAAYLFDTKRTLYSTEGSSLAIRAMLHAACLYAKQKKKKPIIAAGRNAHKVFLYTAAMLDFEVKWIFENDADSIVSSNITPKLLEDFINSCEEKPTAVYITSPDYFGKIADISALSKVCRKHDILLLVDNAHGAYLRFLPHSMHPINLGADMCCDSAHKTLNVLTGGAYLHLSHTAPEMISEQLKSAMALFASTSPSYLILQSLDMENIKLATDYPAELKEFIEIADRYKKSISELGYTLIGDEPLKITVKTKPFGYTGIELSDILRGEKIECEYCDSDYIVFMLSPNNKKIALKRLYSALSKINKKAEISDKAPKPNIPIRSMSIREAMLSPKQTLPVYDSFGKILADATVSCPPAIPILMCGEVIDLNAVECMKYYGIKKCSVVSE